MRSSLRMQIQRPVGMVILLGVAVTASASAYLAARRSARSVAAQLNQMIDTLSASQFPFSQNVLQQMKGLSGAEFVAYAPSGQSTAATIDGPLPARSEIPASVQDRFVSDFPAGPTDIGEDRWFFAAIAERTRPGRAGRETLLVLYPEGNYRRAQRDAIWPPLIVGGVTVIVVLLLSAWWAERFTRRIRRLQAHVARIADGHFHTMPTGNGNDELQDLMNSINRMAQQLQQMQQTIARTERARLLGQLAGGLAHQLRNAVTGARMAVQIHQRRCEQADDSLDVTLQQLSLTEQHVRSLLSVGDERRSQPQPQSVRELVTSVAALVQASCVHNGVQFGAFLDGEADEIPILSASADRLASAGVGLDETTVTVSSWILPDAEPIHAAVLNLVLNAIEAAGRDGVVRLTARNTRVTLSQAKGLAVDKLERNADLAGANDERQWQRQTGSGNSPASTPSPSIQSSAAVRAVVFRVEDTGPGPAEDVQSTLFEPFVTTKPEGVGLGLAVVQQVADRMRGQLRWRRAAGITCFELTVPVASE